MNKRFSPEVVEGLGGKSRFLLKLRRPAESQTLYAGVAWKMKERAKSETLVAS